MFCVIELVCVTGETEIAWHKKPRITKELRLTCLLLWVKGPVLQKSVTHDFGRQRTWVKCGTRNFRGKGKIYLPWRDSSISTYRVLTAPKANTQNGFTARYLTALSFEKSGVRLLRRMGCSGISVSIASTENTRNTQIPLENVIFFYVSLKTEAFVSY